MRLRADNVLHVEMGENAFVATTAGLDTNDISTGLHPFLQTVMVHSHIGRFGFMAQREIRASHWMALGGVMTGVIATPRTLYHMRGMAFARHSNFGAFPFVGRVKDGITLTDAYAAGVRNTCAQWRLLPVDHAAGWSGSYATFDVVCSLQEQENTSDTDADNPLIFGVVVHNAGGNAASPWFGGYWSVRRYVEQIGYNDPYR